MKTQGKAEVIEAVVIAALTAVATGIVNFIIDKVKQSGEKNENN